MGGRDTIIGVELKRNIDFPEKHWETYKEQILLDKLMRNVLALCLHETRPVAVRIKEIVQPWRDDPRVQTYKYDMYLSVAREVPIDVAIPRMRDYTHHWTLWQRIKFVFTNKLPY